MPECALLLSALAHLDDADAPTAARAFDLGRKRLGPQAAEIKRLPRAEIDDADIERALRRLQRTDHGLRKRVIDACAECVLADGAVTIEEAELVRMIAVFLKAPLPSFLTSASR